MRGMARCPAVLLYLFPAPAPVYIPLLLLPLRVRFSRPPVGDFTRIFKTVNGCICIKR